MKKTKNSRSHGSDFLDACSLNLAYPLIENSILHIINLSIEEGTVPNAWKTQLVHPLYKKDDAMNGENYRPVSHITEISKLLEYAVHEQVYEHFSANNLFHSNHHGFIKDCSTSTALAQLYDLWLSSAEKKKITGTLLLDLSSAFDVVDHSIFLNKLKCYGFSSGALDWFASYLGNRQHIIQVGNKFSKPAQVGDYGIPQGSILGPLVFIIFGNDFPASSEEGEAVMYCDDDTENASGDDPEEVKEKIQREADRATDWAQDNKMICAGGKTKLLLIGTKQLKRAKLNGPDKIKIKVCGVDVEESESEKLLGLVINNNLTWSDYLHGEQWRTSNNFPGLIPQLSRRIGLLKRVVHLMPAQRFKLVVNGLFHSKLVYCLHVFGNVWGLTPNDETDRRYLAFTKLDNHRLQVLQNQSMRLLLGARKDEPTVKLLNETKSLSVHQLTAFSTLVSIQKVFHKQRPEYFFKKLEAARNNNGVQSTRQSDSLRLEGNLTLTRGGYLYRACTLWNNLPAEFKGVGKLRLPIRLITFTFRILVQKPI